MKKDWRNNIRAIKTPQGLTIWIGSRWIVDLSCLKETNVFTVAIDERIKKLKMAEGVNRQDYQIIGDVINSDKLSRLK